MPRQPRPIARYTTKASNRAASVFRCNDGTFTVRTTTDGAPTSTGTCESRQQALRAAAMHVWPALTWGDTADALARFAKQHGARKWVERLQVNWMNARLEGPDGSTLHQLRNNFGHEVLAQAAAAFTN